MAAYNDLIHALAEQVGLPPSAIHEAVQQALDEHQAEDTDEQHGRITRLRLLELEASLRIHHELEPGDCVYLAPNEPHALEATEPSHLSLVMLRDR